MTLIKFATNGINSLLKPSHNIREIIPGWDDDYPDPIFTDDWGLTSELNLESEEDELIAQYDYSD